MVSRIPNTKTEQDAAYDPEHVKTAKILQDAEQDQRDAFDRDFENPERMAKDGIPGDLSGGAREAEKAPYRNRVSSKYAGNKSEPGRKLTPANARAVLKKRGPLGLLLTLVFGGGAAGFMGFQSLLPIHIAENFMTKYDTQNTSLVTRADRLLAKKLTDDTTSGSCTYVKIACRFSRPSNKFLRGLARNNIRALDALGAPIDTRPLWPNSRPASYEFTDSNGKKLPPVEARNLHKTLKTNPEFRRAFNRAYLPRYVSFIDDVFQSIKTRFGVRTNDKLANGRSRERIQQTINETVAGEDVGARAAAGTGEAVEESEKIIRRIFSSAIGEKLSKLVQSGKGDVVGLVAGATCLVADGPGMIIKVVRAYQLVQLVKYATVILTTIYAMKAGDATTEEVAVIGSLLVSAMNSFGMRYTLFGDTKAKNNNYKKFSPGSSIISVLGDTVRYTNSSVKKGICTVATNPVTGGAINAALATTGVGVVAAALNIVGGFVLSEALEKVLPYALPLIMDFVSPFLNTLLNYFVGDLTQGLAGEDVGDAFTSGASHLLGQTANKGGNMALTVGQRVVYDQKTKEVQLAYAEEERSVRSPLDATSPYTMLGSFVNKLIPYYSSAGSVVGMISTIKNIVAGSFGSMLGSLKSSALDANEEQYRLCEDPEIKDNDIAAGPFCDISYGIPVEYLDKDPVTVVNSLVASGDVDEDSGEPKGDYKKWLDLCTDGTTDNANNCKIDDTTANYAVYTVDYRVQTGMDEEEGQDTSSDTTGFEDTLYEPITKYDNQPNSTLSQHEEKPYINIPTIAKTNSTETPSLLGYISYIGNSYHNILPQKREAGITI